VLGLGLDDPVEQFSEFSDLIFPCRRHQTPPSQQAYIRSVRWLAPAAPAAQALPVRRASNGDVIDHLQTSLDLDQADVDVLSVDSQVSLEVADLLAQLRDLGNPPAEAAFR
jgi:hypothetical protein